MTNLKTAAFVIFKAAIALVMVAVGLFLLLVTVYLMPGIIDLLQNDDGAAVSAGVAALAIFIVPLIGLACWAFRAAFETVVESTN